MDGIYGSNLRHLKLEEVKMTLKDCDYHFNPKDSEWHMTVRMGNDLDLENNMLDNSQNIQGKKVNYKQLLRKLQRQNERIQQKIQEMNKKIDDMESRCVNSEQENEHLMDEYACEYLEAEKLSQMKQKLEEMQLELGGDKNNFM